MDKIRIKAGQNQDKIWIKGHGRHQKNNECQDKHESIESEYQVKRLLELLG